MSLAVPARSRTAHPYRDLDVIDARAPRTNQAVVAIGALLAIVTGVWPILALLALQLGVGLRFGRRYCLPCVAYFELVQPRIGEGPIEDSRPPRFANQIGFTVLTAATAAYVVGLPLLGLALGGLVAALALLAARCDDGVLRGMPDLQGRRPAARRPEGPARPDRACRRGRRRAGRRQPGRRLWPSAVHRLQAFEKEVRASGRPLVTVDVRTNRQVARKYGIALVPTAFSVAPDGGVLARLAG